jgi:hypothetical protein
MNTNDWIDLLARHEGPVDRHASAKRLGWHCLVACSARC